MGACTSSGKKKTSDEEDELAVGRVHSGTLRMREKEAGGKPPLCGRVLLKTPKAKEEYLRRHESFRFFEERLGLDPEASRRRGTSREEKQKEKLSAYLDECVDLYCHALNRYGEVRLLWRGGAATLRQTSPTPPPQLNYKSFSAAFGLTYDHQVEQLCKIFDQVRGPRCTATRPSRRALSAPPPPLPTGQQQPHLVP